MLPHISYQQRKRIITSSTHRKIIRNVPAWLEKPLLLVFDLFDIGGFHSSKLLWKSLSPTLSDVGVFLPSSRLGVPTAKWRKKTCWNVTKTWVRVTWRKSSMWSMRSTKLLISIMMAKLVGRCLLVHERCLPHRSFLRQDFQEFVIGFLLTTKGSMEEKLDYTFQLYG